MLTVQSQNDERYLVQPQEEPMTTLHDDEDPIMLAKVIFQLLEGQSESTLFDNIIKIRKDTLDKRQNIQQDAQQMLQALSRSAEQAKLRASQSTRNEDALNHTNKIESLNASQSTCQSDITTLRQKIQSSQQRLEQLRQDTLRLEEEERQEASEPLHQNTVTLAIYQSLGITFLDKDSETGKYQKCIVRSRESNSVEELKLDSSYSSFFYANYLWDASK